MFWYYFSFFLVFFPIGIGSEYLLYKKGVSAFLIAATAPVIAAAAFMIYAGLGFEGIIGAILVGLLLFGPIYVVFRVGRDLNVMFVGSAIGAVIAVFIAPWLIFGMTFTGA